METVITAQGSRMVKSSRNDSTSPWTSSLYVNGGKTITTIRAKHATVAGAKKWATKQVAA